MWKYFSPSSLVSVMLSSDPETLDENSPDQHPVTASDMWCHPASQSAPLDRKAQFPICTSRCREPSAFFSSCNTNSRWLKHTYFKWEEVCVFAKREAFFTRPLLRFCRPHWQQSEMVIELVGWRQRGSSALSDSISCRLPAVQFTNQSEQLVHMTNLLIQKEKYVMNEKM